MVTNEIRKEISHSRECSDIYGLVEKMAYAYHLGSPSNSAEKDWYHAQENLFRWGKFQLSSEGNSDSSLGQLVHRVLQRHAHEKHVYPSRDLRNSPFDDWVVAQEKLAEQVIRQVTII